ncbi:MAG: hypothetical protein WC374_01070 [Phycisphaerae bacterium]|jgi:hypothetical protein
MKKTKLLLLWIMLVVFCCLGGCVTAKYHAQTGDVEYNRLGDLKTSAVTLEVNDPNTGKQLAISIGTSESKGELNIDTLAEKIATAVIALSAGTP